MLCVCDCVCLVFLLPFGILFLIFDKAEKKGNNLDLICEVRRLSAVPSCPNNAPSSPTPPPQCFVLIRSGQLDLCQAINLHQR